MLGTTPTMLGTNPTICYVQVDRCKAAISSSKKDLDVTRAQAKVCDTALQGLGWTKRGLRRCQLLSSVLQDTRSNLDTCGKQLPFHSVLCCSLPLGRTSDILVAAQKNWPV